MRKLIAASAFAMALGAGPALADATTDVFAANTVVATGANGVVMKLKFNPGGAYTGTVNDQATAGTWAVENGQFCLTPQGAEKSCSPHSGARKVGDTWTVTGADGVTYTVTITAGR
jgi:hypothetical protein